MLLCSIKVLIFLLQICLNIAGEAAKPTAIPKIELQDVKTPSHASFETRVLETQANFENPKVSFSLEFKNKIEQAQAKFQELIDALNEVAKERSKRSQGAFHRPEHKNKFIKLENDMKKLKEELAKIKTSSSIAHEDKERLSNLEMMMENLQRLLDNSELKEKENIEHFETLIENSVGLIGQLTTQVNDLNKKIKLLEDKQRENKPEDIIRDLQSHDFKAAEEKLRSLQDENKINYIIKKVYGHQTGNFDLVLKFGDAIKFSIKTSFLVYKALNYEMTSNGHKDPYKLTKLVKSLKGEVVSQSKVQADTKKEAESLLSSLNNLVIDVTVEELKAAMTTGRYNKDNARMVDLSNHIYLSNYHLYNDLIQKLVNDMYGKEGALKMLKYSRVHIYIGQRAAWDMALYNKMKNSNDMDKNEFTMLAFHIKDSLKYYKADSTSHVKSTLYDLKKKLPNSLQSAMASKVCIKNAIYNEYLYAASNYFSYDSDRRTVFTWTPGEKVSNGEWEIELIDESFHFKNTYHGEYMYCPTDYFSWDSQRRRVFTWSPGVVVSNGEWKIEPHGANFYLKCVYHSEYLFADKNRYYDSTRRRVFTFRPNSKTTDSVWTIEDCSSL